MVINGVTIDLEGKDKYKTSRQIAKLFVKALAKLGWNTEQVLKIAVALPNEVNDALEKGLIQDGFDFEEE